MEHTLIAAAIVLVSFIALAQPKMWHGYGYTMSNMGHGHGHNRICYPNAQPDDDCGNDKRCAWNKPECPNYANCYLICTKNPYKLCYGLNEGQYCNGGDGTPPDNWFECRPDSTGELVCIDVFNVVNNICGG